MTAFSGNILVVDDNEVNRDLMSRRLKKMGHRVNDVPGGQEALDFLAANPVDLVLLDVMMPDMNGYEVLERLKSSDDWKHIPVLMVSALTELDSVVRCVELGAEDYLPKPTKPAILNARVSACLERKRLVDKEMQYLSELESEKKRSDDLLNVIFPEPVVAELKEHNTVKPRRFEKVAVLFCDVVGFTDYCNNNAPETVVKGLQDLVERYEELCLKYGVEKIKTIGDCFMATGGLLQEISNPVLACANCAAEMIAEAQKLESNWQVRVGISYGPVMAGVVGHRKYLFDVWGDTVNMAARVQGAADPGTLQLTEEAWSQVQQNCEGEWVSDDLKGIGESKMVRISVCHTNQT